MRLLISVGNPTEALAAFEGGADVIDAKDPHRGALGEVSLEMLSEIHQAVSGKRPLSAAIGDAADETTVERRAQTFSEVGTSFVKVGFGGIDDPERITALMRATRRGLGNSHKRTQAVAVAYADAERVGSSEPAIISEIAARAGMDGLLIDTADKRGPGLCGLADLAQLTAWVAGAHKAGMFVALAGKLTSDDLGLVMEAGADIAGVRGAACRGGRTGAVDTKRVHSLRERIAVPLTRV